MEYCNNIISGLFGWSIFLVSELVELNFHSIIDALIPVVDKCSSWNISLRSGSEFMFHVSTLLPYSYEDLQQVNDFAMSKGDVINF